ncbi:ATP-binding cassette domain-containing protein [Noviherbaspirillum malthae]|uniref:ATP-binding cassette domain-containing protein n=1 Tax=Noviherbaspirillum malthae TaxID=1260987 RepID=UPI00188E4769
MNAAAVAAQDLRKIYPGERGVLALDSISLDVQPGEFFSILGSSGCGKSTFLRCVAAVETTNASKLTVQGRPVNGPPDNIGMVFQRDALLEWRSVEGNILLPVEFKNKPTAAYRQNCINYLSNGDQYERQITRIQGSRGAGRAGVPEPGCQCRKGLRIDRGSR